MSAVMPYVKWHGRDWLGDPMLRMVGPEVRGVWIDLLCAMMNADPYGHLAVNGRPMTDDQAARMCGLDKGTFKAILDQIEQANISSRTACGMLYSRRLVRDHEAFLRSSNAGRKGGGNPNVRSHSPETRNQKPEAKDPLKGPFKGATEDKPAKRATSPRGEFGRVMLTDDEYSRLVAAHGKDKADKGVAVLDGYIEGGGKRYRNHYAVMNATSWVWERVAKADGASQPPTLRSWLPSGTGGL